MGCCREITSATDRVSVGKGGVTCVAPAGQDPDDALVIGFNISATEFAIASLKSASSRDSLKACCNANCSAASADESSRCGEPLVVIRRGSSKLEYRDSALIGSELPTS